MAIMLRNRWPESIGMGGRLRPESPAGIERNMHIESAFSNGNLLISAASAAVGDQSRSKANIVDTSCIKNGKNFCIGWSSKEISCKG